MIADPTRIRKLLAAQLPGASELRVGRPQPVFGGNARRAWAFPLSWQGSNGAGATEVEAIMLSRVEAGQLTSDPARELGVLQALGGSGARAPRAFAADRDGSVVGAPSIVLERIAGDASPAAFLDGADAAAGRALATDLARAAAELHAVDWRARGLRRVLGEDTPAAQLAHWEERFRATRMEPHPVLAAIFRMLHERLPAVDDVCVVHGDFRPGNVLYDGQRVTALLDWELAHLGDPAEDIAWAYRPFWSPQRLLSLEAFVAAYEQAGGRPIDRARLRFYQAFAEAKMATISLAAARVFADGGSRNARLADRAATTTGGLTRCLELLEAGDAGDGA